MHIRKSFHISGSYNGEGAGGGGRWLGEVGVGGYLKHVRKFNSIIMSEIF